MSSVSGMLDSAPVSSGSGEPAGENPDDGVSQVADGISGGIGPAQVTRPEARSSVARSATNAALAIAALVLALIGQYYFKSLKYPWDGAVFFAAAIAIFLVLARRLEVTGEVRPSVLHRALESMRSRPIPTALVLLSVVLSYTAVRFLVAHPGNTGYWDIFAIWVASVLCYCAAFIRFPALDPVAWIRRHAMELLVVSALTGVAALLRFRDLGRIPNIISGDEGQLGVLALNSLAGQLNNMFATVLGHSTLYIFVIGWGMKLFGADPTGLRVTSAVAGMLTVPAVYVFARRYFGQRTALIAASLVTVSHIHLHFSRIVVTGSIQDALFATVSLYLLLSGLDRRSVSRLVLSAAIMGLHLYFYMGARLLIPLVPVYVFILWFFNPRLVRENLKNLTAGAGALFVVATPMMVWMATRMPDFMARANATGIIQSGWLVNETKVLDQTVWQILATQFAQAFMSINAYPATSFYNAKLPMLDWLTGAVFMLGLAYSLYHVTDRRHLLLNGWFWSGVIIGGAMVVLPATSAYRILIVFPAVCILVAVGWDRLVAYVGQSTNSMGRWLPSALTTAFVAGFAFINLHYYFVDYGPSCLYEDPNTRFASYMGQALGEAGPSYRGYLFGYPRIWYGIHPSVDFLSGKNPIQDVKEPLTGPPSFVDPHQNAIFFFTPEREGELAVLQQYLPGGDVRRILDCNKLMLTVYQVGE